MLALEGDFFRHVMRWLAFGLLSEPSVRTPRVGVARTGHGIGRAMADRRFAGRRMPETEPGARQFEWAQVTSASAALAWFTQ
jgi:hypothetical protein